MTTHIRRAGEIVRGAKRRAQSLARGPRKPFADLAAELFRIHEVAPHRFADVAQEVGVSPRTGYYLVRIWGQIRHHPERKRLERLGWSRLRLVAPHLEKATGRKLLDFAEKHTVQEIQQHLKRQPIKEKTRCMLLRFSAKDYARFAEVMI